VNKNRKYIILWKNHLRLGCLDLSDKKRAELKDLLYLSLLQIDITGTEHYEVLGFTIQGKKIKPSWKIPRPVEIPIQLSL